MEFCLVAHTAPIYRFLDSVPTARLFIKNNISTKIPSPWDVLNSKFGMTHIA